MSCSNIETNIHVDCINKFNKLITDLHQWVETNKQSLKAVAIEQKIKYLIQRMNSGFIKLKIESDNVIDIYIYPKWNCKVTP